MSGNHAVELSIALHSNPVTSPILEGRISAQGVRFIPTALHGSEIFWRQLKYGDFDISDMSLSSLFIVTSRGDRQWVALPIFTMRGFFHTGIMVRADRGIDSPADLKGKRIGVPEYQQTSAIWSRGILQHEFGVHPQDIEWFMERPPERSHGGAVGFVAPAEVRIRQIPRETNIGELFAKGELDGTLLYLNDRNLVDRSRIELAGVANIRTLFPDPDAEKRRFYAKTGIMPINHTLVVRRKLIETHPWLALNIYSAFLAAKMDAMNVAHTVLKPYFETGAMGPDALAALSHDPMAYGMAAARPILETIADYVHEQGLTTSRVKLEDVFAPCSFDL